MHSQPVAREYLRIPDKDGYPLIFKELLQLNNKKPNNLIIKRGKGPEWTFLQRRHTSS